MEFFANQIQPPASPIDQFSKLAALQAMGQQAQLRNQQIQAANLENQQRQQAVKDQQTILGLYQKHQGDLDKVIQDAPAAGVTPNSIQALQQHQLQVKTQTADLVAKQGTEAARQADLMLGAHDAVDKAPADQKPVIYQQQIASLKNQGVDVSQLPPEYPGDDQFKMLGIVARAHSKNVDDALKASEQSKNTAQAASANAQAAKINTEINPNNPADPNIARQKYEGILSQVQQKGVGSLSPQDYMWAKAYENAQKKTTTQSDSLGVTSVNTSGPSGLAAAGAGKGGAPVAAPAVTPQGGAPAASPKPAAAGGAAGTTNSIVDLIGQYKYNSAGLNRVLAKHPEILAQVAQKYPDFDQTTYNAKNHLITSYTSGQKSGEINAINTAMGHVNVLDSAIDALNNGDVKVLNGIANKLGIQLGASPAATFKLIVHRVGPEISSAYIPGGGGEKERFANEEDFADSLAPNILHNNAAMTVKLLRSKVGALENQYKQTVGRDDFNQRFITPEARASFDKFASHGGGNQGGGGKFSVTAPNGKTYTFPDQASADAFKAKLPK